MKTHLENISYNLSDEYTKDYGKITYDKMEKYYDFGNVSYTDGYASHTRFTLRQIVEFIEKNDRYIIAVDIYKNHATGNNIIKETIILIDNHGDHYTSTNSIINNNGSRSVYGNGFAELIGTSSFTLINKFIDIIKNITIKYNGYSNTILGFFENNNDEMKFFKENQLLSILKELNEDYYNRISTNKLLIQKFNDLEIQLKEKDSIIYTLHEQIENLKNLTMANKLFKID